MQSQSGEALSVSLALILGLTVLTAGEKGQTEVHHDSERVLRWPEDQSKAPSHDRMVLAHHHEAFGEFRKLGWDEVVQYQLRASAPMTHKLVTRIRRVFIPLKYLLHNQAS